MSNDSLSPLAKEEYIEQMHFFQSLSERLSENRPAQEVLSLLREEVLVTTNLPKAIDFLLSELRHLGMFSQGMSRLSHYFSPFQCYVMKEAENDRSRFDMRIGLDILCREAEYRADETMTRPGLFLYQFEALCRNRLGYDEGLEAMAADPTFNEPWQEWILTVRRQIGLIELADLIYVRSEFYHRQSNNYPEESTTDPQNDREVLFGMQEGRIAWANRKKDPLLLFAALHRQLGYPEVPKTQVADPEERLIPVLARRVEQLESRLKLVEEEQRGGIQLERFYSQESDSKPTD